MGYIKHNAMIFTGSGYPEATEKLMMVHAEAVKLFGPLVSRILPQAINMYESFFIAPDGSKEGWKESDDYDKKRKELADFVDKLAYEDYSNAIQFVDIAYDECGDSWIERTNYQLPDEEPDGEDE